MSFTNSGMRARRQAHPAAGPSTSCRRNPARAGVLEAALADAEALLLEVGFLYPHTAHARMAKLRALLQRAQVGARRAGSAAGHGVPVALGEPSSFPSWTGPLASAHFVPAYP